jgi:hypothetical protein
VRIRRNRFAEDSLVAKKKSSIRTSVSLPKTLEAELRDWADSSAKTIRDQISKAVEANLREIVAALNALGLDGQPGHQRPRRLNEPAWEALAEAERKTGLTRSLLLRCCLTIALRKQKGAARRR